MTDPNKILEAYIEQILRIQQDRNRQSLSVEELEKIASDLGMSQSDLKLIESKFKDFLARGQGYSRYRNWDKAIEELGQAVLLKPLHIETLFGLADAYKNRWSEKGKNSDKENALLYAERCLQSDARNEGALFLVSQLNNKKSVRSKIKQRYIRLSIVLAFVFLTLALGYVGFQLIFPTQISSQSDKNGQDKTIETTKNLFIKENLDIPIGLVENLKSNGLHLDFESSYLKKTSEGFVYQFKGSLITQKFEIDALQIKLELINQKNEIIYTTTVDILEDLDYEARQGDAIPITLLIQEKKLNENIKRATLEVIEIQKTIAPDTYEDSPILNPTWEIPQTENMDFILRQRYQTIKPEADIFSHEIVFEIKNTGKSAIKTLQIQIEWYDLNEELIHTETLELINLTQTILKPKQKRIKAGSYLIDLKLGDFKEYKVKILQIG